MFYSCEIIVVAVGRKEESSTQCIKFCLNVLEIQNTCMKWSPKVHHLVRGTESSSKSEKCGEIRTPGTRALRDLYVRRIGLYNDTEPGWVPPAPPLGASGGGVMCCQGLV